MKRLALMLLPLAACIDFSKVRADFCAATDAGECMAGTAGGGAATGGGSAATGGGSAATGGGTAAMGGGGAAAGGGAALGGGSAQGGGGGGGLPPMDAGPPRCAGTDTSCKAAPDAGPASQPTLDAGTGLGIYYVSPSGHDSSDGGSMAEAWLTVTHAIATAPAGSEIHVCAGTYPTKMIVNKTLYLRGSYACGTFTRDAGYGWLGPDAGFDHGQLTRLTAVAGSCDDKYVLAVQGGAPVIDGFAIEGATGCSSYTQTPFTVKVDNGAYATVINNEITGSDGFTSVIAGGALALLHDAGAEIAFNRISGGGGTSSTREGSVGILFDQNPGTSHIHDNVISGGSGQNQGPCDISPFGSVGIEVFNGPSTVPLTIERNRISGGSGTGNAVHCFGSGGVYLAFGLQQSVNVVDNFIEGGSGVSLNGPWNTVAVMDNDKGSSLIARNAIAGGPSAAAAIVVDVGNSNYFYVINNMIHAGSRLQLGSSTGLRLSGAGVGTVAHNTFVVENGSSAATLASTNTAGNPSDLTGMIFSDNLVLGAQNFFPAAVTVEQQAMLSSFDNNGFTGSGSLVKLATQVFSSPQAFESVLNTGSTTSVFNFQLTPSCADGGAVDCSGDGGCIGGVIDWGAPDRGYSALVSRAGWPLASGTACRVMRSELDLTTVIPDDFYGRPRAAHPSVGAAEMYCGCR